MHQSIVEFLCGTEFLLADARLHRVEAADEVQSPRRRVGFGALRLEQLATGVRPALRVGQPGLLRVVRIGGIAIAEQNAALDRRQTERFFDVLDPATLEERETDLVQFAINRPEIRGLQLPRSGTPGLDRRLVHRLDARGADRGELRLVDGREQRNGLLPDLRQPRPADRDAAIGKTLVLAVERQVVGKLVDQQAGDEADVGATALDDTDRRRRADDRPAFLDLDDGPPVIENHRAARTLRQPIAVPVADDFILFRRQSLSFGCAQFDDFDRYPRSIEEGKAVVAGVGLLGYRPPRVRRDLPRGQCRRWGNLILGDGLSQTHLTAGVVDDAALALLAENLALLEVLYSIGIRRMELVKFTLYDVDRRRGALMIREGKGKKDRLIPIGERALAWVEKYRHEGRPALVVGKDSSTLFLANQGIAFRRGAVSARIKRYIRQAGIEVEGSCHLFRHAMATDMLENGADIRFIQAMLGHEDLSTTKIYTQVSIEKLRQIHAATHPARPGRSKSPDKTIAITEVNQALPLAGDTEIEEI